MGSRAATNHPQYGIGKVDLVNVAYLRFLGTPAPSSLEDGHLTLGKALTLPRVSGHPTGAETPRAESLVVHYDTTVDSVVSGSTVVDISGEGSNGTLHGVTYSVPNRTLHGDGISAGDYTKTPITISGGAMPFSISMWFRPETFLSGTSTSVLSFMGNKSAGAGVIFSYRQNAIWQDLYGKGVEFTVSLSLNRWYHVTTTYNGGNIESGSSKMYLDGVEIQSYLVSGTGSVNLPTSTNLELFDYINASNDRHQGDISNFKLWNVALTADEIRADFALGRTGKSLNLTDTSLCLGGTVPRAQLDVQGTARFNSVSNFHTGKLVGTGLAVLNPLEVGGYDEGLWTPTFSAVTVTMGNSYGKYVRIGSLVYVTFDMSYSGLNTNDGSGIHITGLPFAQLNGGNHYDEPALVSIHERTTMFSLEPGGGRYSAATLLISKSDNSTYIKYNNCAASGRLIGCGQYMII
jgi:hypothetical protein